MKEIKLIMAAVAISLSAGFVSCSEDDNNEAELPIAVAVNNSYPSDFIAKDATFKSGIITFTELNTQKQTVVNLTGIDDKFDTTLPVGVYDYKGEINYTVKLADNSTKDLVLRTVGNSVAVSQATTLSFDWFMSNPSQGLVLSEIYAAGSFNAKKTGGIRDNYIRIYNNSDATLYADGLAICESDFVNSKTNNNTILTEANFRENNFTAGTVWVIPGNGKEVPVEPGKYITIADRAINWGEETEGGLNLTGASVVIHADPWWNAAAQNQATDRAHRIGQTRDVSVFKVIADGTIEERIVRLQEAKSSLADAVLGADSASLAALSRDELIELLAAD